MTSCPSASTSHSISSTLMPFPIASSMSNMAASNPSSAVSCSLTNSDIAWSSGSFVDGCTSHSSPVTANFLVCICENRCGSFSSISSKSSICLRTFPSFASLRILASRTGFRPTDGYVEKRSLTSLAAIRTRTGSSIPVSVSGSNTTFPAFLFFFPIKKLLSGILPSCGSQSHT